MVRAVKNLQNCQISSRKTAPWMTPAVKEVKRQRRRAERKWRKSKQKKLYPQLDIDRKLYQLKNFEIAEVIANEKRCYCLSKINECNTSKALYTITNELSGKSFNNILPNNIPKENIPDDFCKFFNEKVENIRKELDRHDTKPIHVPFLGQCLSEFNPVSEENVKNIIMSSNAKSCNLDPIPTSILRQNIDILIEPITRIINLSLKNGKVPSDFKSAILTPIIKKPSLDQNTLINYRPSQIWPFYEKL